MTTPMGSDDAKVIWHKVEGPEVRLVLMFSQGNLTLKVWLKACSEPILLMYEIPVRIANGPMCGVMFIWTC